MRDDTTIFDGIITTENSFTELFKNFLKFSFFRELFLELLEIPIDKENVTYDSFDTQYTISHFGRPDLALCTDISEILIEIKVYNTSLTPNQPLSYYKHLRTKCKAKHKGLILIIPDDYYDINRYQTELKKIANSNDNIYTQIIFWNTLVGHIEKKEIANVSLLFNEYTTFISNWFQMKPIFLNSLNITTMFGKEFPNSLYTTLDIVYRIFN